MSQHPPYISANHRVYYAIYRVPDGCYSIMTACKDDPNGSQTGQSAPVPDVPSQATHKERSEPSATEPPSRSDVTDALSQVVAHTYETGHEFNFAATKIIAQAGNKTIRELIEAWAPDENSVNRFIDLAPA
ncbi:hypothetical protein SprV_0401676500 [Sparganum proliferum]